MKIFLKRSSREAGDVIPIGNTNYKRLFIEEHYKSKDGVDYFHVSAQWIGSRRIINKSKLEIPQQLWFTDSRNELVIGKSILIKEEYFNSMKIEV